MQATTEELETAVSQQNSGQSEDFPEFLTVDEFSQYVRISRGSAYKAVNSGQVPGVIKFNRTIRISRKALDESFSKIGTPALADPPAKGGLRG